MHFLVFEPEVVTPYILGRREYMVVILYRGCGRTHIKPMIMMYRTVSIYRPQFEAQLAHITSTQI
jgi:hypothetical protein